MGEDVTERDGGCRVGLDAVRPLGLRWDAGAEQREGVLPAHAGVDDEVASGLTKTRRLKRDVNADL